MGGMAIMAAATVASAAFAYKASKRNKPPAMYDGLAESEAIKNQMNVVNNLMIKNTRTGNMIQTIRNPDGSMGIAISNNGTNNDVKVRKIDTDVAEITNIGGRNINSIMFATGVTVVAEALMNLSKTIQSTENSHPFFIQANKPLLDSIKVNSDYLINQGFNKQTTSVLEQLARTGKSNSSMALGEMVRLEQQKVFNLADAELKRANFATELKQQAIDNLHKDYSLTLGLGQLELNKYGAEANVWTTLRNQDYQREQFNSEARLKQEQMRLDTEFRNRELDAQDKSLLLNASLAAMGQNNSNALGAATLRNNAINQRNHTMLNRYSMNDVSPLSAAAQQFAMNNIGAAGQAFTNYAYGSYPGVSSVSPKAIQSQNTLSPNNNSQYLLRQRANRLANPMTQRYG